MLGHGISGPPSGVQAFNDELLELRGSPGRFLGVYEPGLGHGNLQDWRIAVRHLSALRQLDHRPKENQPAAKMAEPEAI